MVVMHWADIIRQVVRAPLNRQQGADIDEIRRSLRVLDAVDRATSDELELEDADWQVLKDKVVGMRWGVIDERLVQFHDDIVGATAEHVVLATDVPEPSEIPIAAAATRRRNGRHAYR